jgi:putative FmdB family regulatory protein
MPIYEYRCDNCGHEFETIQKVSEDPLKTCPACSEETLRKKISASGFRLKGGGWYETDFKKGSKKNVAGEGGGKETAASEGSNGSAKGGSESGSGSGGAGSGGGGSDKPAADKSSTKSSDGGAGKKTESSKSGGGGSAKS